MLTANGLFYATRYCMSQCAFEQSAGSGARCGHQNAVEAGGEGHASRICGDDLNICQRYESPHQRRTMGMKFQCSDGGFGILFGNDPRLSTRRRAAVENALAVAQQ